MNVSNGQLMVDLQNVSMTYQGYTPVTLRNHSPVLKNIDLQLKTGSVTGLLGRNGSGKSTLIKIVLGLLKPNEGTVHLFEKPVMNLNAELRKRIGYVAQSEVPFSWMTFSDALNMVSSFYPNWDHELTKHYTQDWGLNKAMYIEDMSDGEKQKVAIILAIGHRPDLLILDEPVASLDPAARRQFIQALVELNDHLNKTILFSTHIISDVERIATEVAILHKTGITFHGNVDDLKESCARLYLAGSSLPAELIEPDISNYQLNGSRATAFARNWNEARSTDLSRKTGWEVVTEPLALEEVFLEFTDV
jgi:ABC-2 type transport system ATP-binding protein